MNSLTLTQPDDWHLHLRDGAALASVLPHTARQFARAIVMPNLRPPVTTAEMAFSYRERILAALPQGMRFEPLMTLYLTDNTHPEDIVKAQKSGFVHGLKYYPAGATTNSDSGVTRIEAAFPALAAMEERDMPLLVHGEVTTPEIDVFDREKVFIDTVMSRIIQNFPRLRVVFEHITTADAVKFVREARPNIAATITAHHLLYNRNAIFQGGIRPHYYCLPVLKRENHRQALIEAATGSSKKFFLGTDSAPHPHGDKETACGCAGCYTAHAALELYAEAFDEVSALDRLEAFASFNGPDFYRLPRNSGKITLLRREWEVPQSYPFGDSELTPLRAGEKLHWRLQSI